MNEAVQQAIAAPPAPAAALVRIEDDARPGPAMLALWSDQVRHFVRHFCEMGSTGADAARAAGYSDAHEGALASRASYLLHRADVLEAVREVSIRIMRAHGPMCISVLHTIAKDTTAENKDRIKAATELMNRGGLHAISESRIEVTHKTEQQKDAEIEALARELGLDEKAQRALLGRTIDVPFVEIVDPLTDITAPREPRGAKINPNAGHTAEERAAVRARRHETAEQKAARKKRNRAEHKARLKGEYAAAQATKIVPSTDGLEDVLGLIPFNEGVPDNG